MNTQHKGSKKSSNYVLVGNQLKEAREKNGFSIEQIAKALNLTSQFIVEIESGCYESLGPWVYIRGYIRNYANFIGINTQEILAMLLPTHQKNDPANKEKYSQNDITTKVCSTYKSYLNFLNTKESTLNAKNCLIILLFLCSIGFLFYMIALLFNFSPSYALKKAEISNIENMLHQKNSLGFVEPLVHINTQAKRPNY